MTTRTAPLRTARLVAAALWIQFYDPRKKSLIEGLPFVPVDLLEKSDFEGHCVEVTRLMEFL